MRKSGNVWKAAAWLRVRLWLLRHELFYALPGPVRRACYPVLLLLLLALTLRQDPPAALRTWEVILFW